MISSPVVEFNPLLDRYESFSTYFTLKVTSSVVLMNALPSNVIVVLRPITGYCSVLPFTVTSKQPADMISVCLPVTFSVKTTSIVTLPWVLFITVTFVIVGILFTT